MLFLFHPWLQSDPLSYTKGDRFTFKKWRGEQIVDDWIFVNQKDDFS